IDNTDNLEEKTGITAEESKYAFAAFGNEQSFVSINRYNDFVFILLVKNQKTDQATGDACRKAGGKLQATCNKLKLKEVTIGNASSITNAALLVAEGVASAN